ncbi:MAG: hypothetical protein K2X35_22770 [Bryobacteraceae bacterium]|nr:hypothetical protein [Bryobacteraceae bacterium]
MRKPFVETLENAAEQNPDIFLITGDLGFGVLEPFARRFPRQFLNAGIAEQSMTALAAGLAREGRVVFTYSIANFSALRPLEFVRNDICGHQANVKIVGLGGGFSYGALGFSHHATEDLAVMSALPGMTVIAPGDDYEARELTRLLAAHSGPAYLRLDCPSAPACARTEVALGRASQLRDGRDVTLVATGAILSECWTASELLSDRGIECRVLSMHTLAPIDRAAIRGAAEQTGGIITVEEHSSKGGLGTAAAEVIADEDLRPQSFLRLGIRNPAECVSGCQDFLRRRHGLDSASIAGRVENLLRTTGRARERAL